MSQAGKKPNPYTSFKDDSHRHAALISRDIRYALIALVTAMSTVLGAVVGHSTGTAPVVTAVLEKVAGAVK